MAPAMFPSSPQIESSSFQKIAGSAGTQGAQSRSTSAGSTPSDSQGSTDPSLPPRASLDQGYPEKKLGLPEYDYPVPFSIASRQLPVAGFPTPLVVKNTFIDTSSCLRPSTVEFYAERQTKSCPASGVSLSSGISLPPGLEDLFEPEETSAKIAAAESSLMPDMTEMRVTPSAMNFLPSGLFDDHDTATLLPLPPQQPPVFDTNWQSLPAPPPVPPMAFDTKWLSTLSSAPPLAPPAFEPNWQSAMSPVPLHAPLFDVDWRSPVSPAPPLAPHQPVVLDLLQALSSPLEAVDLLAPRQPPFFNGVSDQLATMNFSLPEASRTGDIVVAAEAELGSPECPTVGSQGHWSGACKPCAFLYSKGCDNGVLCSFCHLCDEGEKKRRAKDKRAALRGTKQSCSTW